MMVAEGHARGQLRLAFAPVHVRAFGLATGFVSALLVAAVTLFHYFYRPTGALDLGLLGQYFIGYDVSLRGVLVGFCWGGMTGGVLGLGLAFARNAGIRSVLALIRARAERQKMDDFLDSI